MLRNKTFAPEFCSLVCTKICLPWNDVSLVGQSNWIFFFIQLVPMPQSGCFIIQLPPDGRERDGTERMSFHLHVLPVTNILPKFLALDFFRVSHRSSWKNKNAFCRFQISALVPEIFKFEKWVKYANKMTDDVLHSTPILFFNNFNLQSTILNKQYLQCRCHDATLLTEPFLLYNTGYLHY